MLAVLALMLFITFIYFKSHGSIAHLWEMKKAWRAVKKDFLLIVMAIIPLSIQSQAPCPIISTIIFAFHLVYDFALHA